MEQHDDKQPSSPDSSQPRIKPRRIDAPHPAVPGFDTPADEIRSSVTADAEFAGLTDTQDEPLIFHEVGQAEPSSWAAPTADSNPGAAGELPVAQFQAGLDDVGLETEQLADALQEQLRELDHREAVLNARAADVENEWRACQAWHHQRLAETTEREGELSRRQAEMEVFLQREAELAERLRDCQAQELALDEREANLNEREAALVANDHELRSRRQEIEREAAALSRSQQLWQQNQGREEQSLERQRRQMQADIDEQLAQRLEEMDADKASLAQHARGIEHQRQILAREQEAWQHERQQEDQRRAQEQRQTQEEIERRLTAVAARESALDTQQAALDQLRCEIMAAHRQALEMRLIAEQLWAQLKGLMTPAEITQSLAQLRLKMAQQYDLEEKALADRKEELLALADKLAEQHATLKAQRMEFLAWRKTQQEEITHQAEHLCRRVQELSEEKKRLRQLEQSRQSGRQQLEEQLP